MKTQQGMFRQNALYLLAGPLALTGGVLVSWWGYLKGDVLIVGLALALYAAGLGIDLLDAYAFGKGRRLFWRIVIDVVIVPIIWVLSFLLLHPAYEGNMVDQFALGMLTILIVAQVSLTLTNPPPKPPST